MQRFSALVLLAVVGAVFAAPPFPTWPENYRVEGSFALRPVDTPTLAFPNVTIYYDQMYGSYQAYDNALHTVIQSLKTNDTFEIMAAKDHFICIVTQNGGPSARHAHAHMLRAGDGDSVTLQVGLPTGLNFTYAGQDTCPSGPSGMTCNHWERIDYVGGKVNFYEFYVTVDGAPNQYEFLGYDSLFGSHYDHYVFQYSKYTPGYRNPSLFNKPPMCNSSLQHTPATYQRGHSPAHIVSRGLHSEAQSHFRHFVSKHGKDYKSGDEFNTRMLKFTKNLVYINRHNANPTATYKMAVNHLADNDHEEIRTRKGLLGYLHGEGAQRIHRAPNAEIELPTQVDWRQENLVSPVKDQGVCGSCWSFSTTGALEGQFRKKYGYFKILSQQFLVDCSWNGNMGCDGGFQEYAYNYIQQNGGIPTTVSYGPYRMINQFCTYVNGTASVNITGYTAVAEGDEAALQHATASVGPIAVSIDASHLSFVFYSSGVYYEPTCSPTNLDHAVLTIGYGTEDGQDYWLVKNSWSTFWGDYGYIKMARNRGNNCGIATGALYPNVN